MNINNKRFIAIENKSGLSSNETIFHYFQKGNTITGKYNGGEILEGFIIGKKTDVNQVEFLFQCLTKDNELRVGESKGIISKNKSGKLELKFEWNWLNGDLSGGTSAYIEIT
ncbi:hypothetical protein OD91_0136 [Lutibacter sp. Hel_I_33_5]|uniref:hypothetical protein n=1 Tax=Lutibacter sp. Hel_I_33_5 TaxID=1566289 RepID=UPI0011A4EAA6|nr:hypothetical protein [Lutibacter sp. Hel_I_33_5]TVZ54899.1 hypothetical protein OD91_0136 [Lutibacter sp. Hel_I_33_5]